MQWLEGLFPVLEFEVLWQLGLAIVLGGVLGAERELRGRPAGLRTLILVCMGATLVMIVSSRLPAPYAGSAEQLIIRIDPGRIAAGIVTGIGFLGAGVILRLSDVLRGVTTAATIWFVAALGVVIGLGHYALAIVATVSAMLVLWSFSYIERFLQGQIYPTVVVTVDEGKAGAALEQARALFQRKNARLMDLKTMTDVDEATSELQFYLRTHQKFQAHEITSMLATLNGVHRVRWH